MSIKELYDMLANMDDDVTILVDGMEISEIAVVLMSDKSEISYIDIRAIKETA